MRLGCSCGAVLDSRLSTIDDFTQKMIEITNHINHGRPDWVEDNEGRLMLYSERFIKHTDGLGLRGNLFKV